MAGNGWSNQITSLIIIEEGTGYTGLFFYSPTVGHGNLVMSLTDSAGTDPFGNAYEAGFSTYSGGVATSNIAPSTGVTTFGETSGAHFTFEPMFDKFQVANSAGATTISLDASREALFFYSAAAAAGDLLISLAGQAGTDPFGNPYAEGLSIGTATPRIVIGPVAGEAQIYFPTGAIGENDAPGLQAFLQNAGQNSLLVVRAGTPSTEQDYSALVLTSSSDDGTTAQASGDLIYVDTGGTTHETVTTGYGGAAVSGSVTAVVPGTGGSRASVFQTETWHTATLATGFTTNGTDQAPRYRLEGIAGGVVRLDGVALSSGAETAGATIFTLPAGYRPTTRKRFVTLSNATGVVAGGTIVQVNPAGTVVTGATSTVAAQFALDGATFPID